MKRVGKIPEDTILATLNVVGFYPRIPHKEGLEASKVRGRTFMKGFFK